MDIWEEKLVDEMKEGNGKALARCYQLLSPLIYTAIYKICQDKESAKELVQDTFLTVFECVNTYTEKQSFIAWVKKIAFNKTINFLKKHKRIQYNEDEINEQHNVQLCLNQQLENSQLIEQLFDNVSENERLILWLYIVEQYTHDEIGTLLVRSSSYSKAILSRTLKRIRISKETLIYAQLN